MLTVKEYCYEDVEIFVAPKLGKKIHLGRANFVKFKNEYQRITSFKGIHYVFCYNVQISDFNFTKCPNYEDLIKGIHFNLFIKDNDNNTIIIKNLNYKWSNNTSLILQSI